MTFPATEDVQLVQARAGRVPHTYYCRSTVVTGKGNVTSCNRYLFRAVLQPGCYIEMRCPKCGRMGVYRTDTEPKSDIIETRKERTTDENKN